MMKAMLFPVLLSTLMLNACSDQTPVTTSATTPVTAQTLTITHGDIREDYATTGTLIADDRIDIASRIMGFIRKVNVHEGSRIEKGQLLLTIDPTEIQAQLAEAEARLSQSKAQLAESRIDQQRYQSLYKDKMISVERFRKAELALQLATGEQQAAEATLERIKVQMQYASIRSPVSGVVVARHKQAGDIATPGAALLTVENPSNVVIRTFVKEQHIQHIRIGDHAEIIIDAAGLKSDGIITKIVPSADPGTHSYLVKIALPQPGKARTGMFARIHFKMGHSRGILIPDSAIISRADLNGVYILDNNNIAHYRMVRIGRRLNNGVEILTGIKAGDRIVTSNLQQIHSGDFILPPSKTLNGDQAL